MLLQAFKLPWPNPESHRAARQQNSDRYLWGELPRAPYSMCNNLEEILPFLLSRCVWSHPAEPGGWALRAFSYPTSVGELVPLPFLELHVVRHRLPSQSQQLPWDAAHSISVHQSLRLNLWCLPSFSAQPQPPQAQDPFLAQVLLLLFRGSLSPARLPDAPAQSRPVASSSPGAHAPWWCYHG